MNAKRSELSRATFAITSANDSDGDDIDSYGGNGFSPDERQLAKQQHTQEVSPALPSRTNWSASVDQSGVAEICQYVQQLEIEKSELQSQTHLLCEQDAQHRQQLAAAATRIELLQSALQDAMAASETHREEKDTALQCQTGERDRVASLAALLDEAQRKYEDSERARQHAVFKLSALQAAVADENSQRMLAPPSLSAISNGLTFPQQQQQPSRQGLRGAVFTTHVTQDDMSLQAGERIEKYKRELELLRQKLALTSEQAHERQRVAVELALRSAQTEHASALDNIRLECELRLNEWRHDETVRAREVEAAMNEDRYSIRLEMKHALQRAQIEQRVSYLQAQAALATSCTHTQHRAGESDFSFGTLDEVLVRMQLEQLRERRFDALKRVLRIRDAKLEQAARLLWCRWRLETTTSRVLKLNAVLHMHRIVSHLALRKTRTCFDDWKTQTRLLHAHAYQRQALSCWNRMLAAERISHVLQQRQVKRVASLFHRWRLASSTLVMGTQAAGGSAGRDDVDTNASDGGSEQAAGGVVAIEPTADVQSLQDEIKKLHELLAASKSEASRYKRQLLKQFL